MDILDDMGMTKVFIKVIYSFNRRMVNHCHSGIRSRGCLNRDQCLLVLSAVFPVKLNWNLNLNQIFLFHRVLMALSVPSPWFLKLAKDKLTSVYLWPRIKADFHTALFHRKGWAEHKKGRLLAYLVSCCNVAAIVRL